MEILTRDQLWRHMLRTEPRRRFPRYLWGGLLLWIVERYEAIEAICGAALLFAFAFFLCVFMGAMQ